MTPSLIYGLILFYMNLKQAMVLIAGPESEARLLAGFTRENLDAGNVVVATSRGQAWKAIDNSAEVRGRGIDIIVSATRLPDGTTAKQIVDHADQKAPKRGPSVLLYSAIHDELIAGERATPLAQTILAPIDVSDFRKQLQDLAASRK